MWGWWTLQVNSRPCSGLVDGASVRPAGVLDRSGPGHLGRASKPGVGFRPSRESKNRMVQAVNLKEKQSSGDSLSVVQEPAGSSHQLEGERAQR